MRRGKITVIHCDLCLMPENHEVPHTYITRGKKKNVYVYVCFLKNSQEKSERVAPFPRPPYMI